MRKLRYLTKSSFTFALDCETKLFYTGKDHIFANQNIEYSFLESLAKG
jgi:hypothetical protein